MTSVLKKSLLWKSSIIKNFPMLAVLCVIMWHNCQAYLMFRFSGTSLEYDMDGLLSIKRDHTLK